MESRIDKVLEKRRREFDDLCQKQLFNDADSVPPPDDTSCWICLDDEHTETKPLVRSCVCRERDGFAHFDCIVQASTKQAAMFVEHRKTFDVSVDLWTHCSICKRTRRGKLALMLARVRWDKAKDLPQLIRTEYHFSLVHLVHTLLDCNMNEEAHEKCTHLVELTKQSLLTVNPRNIVLAKTAYTSALVRLAKCKMQSIEHDNGEALDIHKKALVYIRQFKNPTEKMQRLEATICTKIGDYYLECGFGGHDAVEFCKKAVEINAKIYGKKDLAYISSKFSLGQAYAMISCYEKALPLLDEGRAEFIQKLGKNHEMTITVQNICDSITKEMVDNDAQCTDYCNC